MVLIRCADVNRKLLSTTVWSLVDPSSSNHKRHSALFKVQWVAPKWPCPPAQPAWRRASQAAASTACRPSRSHRGSGRRNPNPPRLHPEWRTAVWILWLLAQSLSMSPSPRQSPPSPRSVDRRIVASTGGCVCRCVRHNVRNRRNVPVKLRRGGFGWSFCVCLRLR